MKPVISYIRKIAVAAAVTAACASASAQTSIIDSINLPGRSVHAVVPASISAKIPTVKVQKAPETVETSLDTNELGASVRPATSHTTTRAVGFRVQVYSDNNQRSARAEAEKRAGAIRAHFPDYQVYVVFQSPYWRVKAGDFRTRSQAEEAATRMRTTLPAYGKEMRVVKDHITIAE